MWGMYASIFKISYFSLISLFWRYITPERFIWFAQLLDRQLTLGRYEIATQALNKANKTLGDALKYHEKQNNTVSYGYVDVDNVGVFPASKSMNFIWFFFFTTRLTVKYHGQLVEWTNKYRSEFPDTADALDTFNQRFTGQSVTLDGEDTSPD